MPHLRTVSRSLRTLGEGTDLGHPATHGAVERAVLRMLRTSPDAAHRSPRR